MGTKFLQEFNTSINFVDHSIILRNKFDEIKLQFYESKSNQSFVTKEDNGKRLKGQRDNLGLKLVSKTGKPTKLFKKNKDVLKKMTPIAANTSIALFADKAKDDTTITNYDLGNSHDPEDKKLRKQLTQNLTNGMKTPSKLKNQASRKRKPTRKIINFKTVTRLLLTTNYNIKRYCNL